MYTKREIVLKNGEVIAYVEQGQGDQVLLLIHGNFSSALHYEPLIKRLPKNIKVLAPDLRGFGDSSYYNRALSLKEHADDLNLFLEAKEVKKAHVIGWSLGGGVAMEFAAHYQEKTDHLILINATTHKGYPIFKKDKEGNPQIGQAYETPEEMRLDPIQVLPLIDAQRKSDFDFMNYIWDLTIYTGKKPDQASNEIWIKESLKQRNLMDADWALARFNMSDQHNFYHSGTQMISKIKAKVLHVWGKKDIVVPQYMIEDNIEALKDLSTYIEYEEAGHSPLVDVADQLTQDILTFIK